MVDDNPINLRVVSSELKQSGRYRITFSNSGADALRQIAESPPDLILLDIMMPEMSGHEVCQQLKQSGQTRDIPVIFLTAMDDVNDVVKGFELGGADYITKPFNATVLLARVETHLQRYLAHRREREMLAQERLYAYQNGMTQMRSEILHNIGNAVGGIETHVSSQKRFIHTLNRLGEMVGNSMEMLDNRERREELEHILKQTTALLSRDLPQQMGAENDRLESLKRYIYGVIEALRKLSDDQFHSTRIEIESLFQDVTTLLQDELSALQIHTALVGDRPFAQLYLPRGPLTQMLFSLLKNSSQSIHKQHSTGSLKVGQGEIRVVVSTQTGTTPHCTIEVIDNGCGIDPERLPQLMQKGSFSKKQGVHLGLHSAANFIFSVHGAIEIHSEGEGQGARVVVRLPLVVDG